MFVTNKAGSYLLALLWLCLRPALTTAAAFAAEPDAVPHDQGAVTTGTESTTGALGVAKITRNPLTTATLLLNQFNWNFATGPLHNHDQFAPNFQPWIPFHITENVNLLTRTILPYIRQEETKGSGSVFGLGDLNTMLWFSPAEATTFIWGIGPALVFPTATDGLLGSGKFSAGPSAVAASVKDPWLVAVLIQNVWSCAGQSSRPSINQLAAEPFINYGLEKGWYLTSAPLITIDWKAPRSSDRWLVPIGGGGGKVVAIGKQRVDFTLQAFSNIIRPHSAAEWQLRFSVNFVLPGKLRR